MFLNGKSQYYPLKNIVGASFCHAHAYAILWFGMYTQFSSLFISTYRYICLFSGKTLINLNISAKVKILKHPVLKMQKYFMAKNKKINIEDCQNISKMRCRMTKTKTNMKQMFNTYECRACKIETENDQHVLKWYQ